MIDYKLSKLKLLRDFPKEQLAGKTILYRSPYDIGVKEIGSGKYEIKDDSRIRATLSTLKYLIDLRCRIVILTWIKRPDGKVVEKLRSTPHAEALSKLINKHVHKINDCIGGGVRKKISTLNPGELLMLENTRFYSEEMIDDDDFAYELAKNGEIVVFDGFPQAHRIHASTTGILRHLPGVIGFYTEEEIKALTKLLRNPKRPFTCVIGGAKISDKVDAINNLFNIADIILVGGGVANVFLKAEGKSIGDSFIEDVFVDKVKKEKKDWVIYAKEIINKKPKDKNFEKFNVSNSVTLNKVLLPRDLIVTDSLKFPKKSQEITDPDMVPNGWAAADIGNATAKAFSDIISQSSTVFWNGPMGIFENEMFENGTKIVSKALLKVKGDVIVSGGDTIEAVNKYIDISKISHVSLAGGASLELLSGKKIPVLEMLLK